MDEGVLNDLLECSVCLERLDTSSRVLPCQHTFCLKCLKEIVQSHKELRCPECRVLVTVKIEELPPNVLLMRILEGMKNRTPRPRVDQKTALEALARVVERSRDSKPQPAAIAKYDHAQATAGELSFKRGDVINLRTNIDNVWYQGECNGNTGLVHTKYLHMLVELPLASCKALYDFKMSAPDEEGCLTFEKGASITVLRRVDENWAEGRLNDKIGIFPIAFVDMNATAKELMKHTSGVRLTAATEALQARAHQTQQSLRYQQMYLAAPILATPAGAYQNIAMSYSHPIYQNNAAIAKNQAKSMQEVVPFNQKLLQTSIAMQKVNLRQENPFLRTQNDMRLAQNLSQNFNTQSNTHVRTEENGLSQILRQESGNSRQDSANIRQEVDNVRHDGAMLAANIRQEGVRLRQEASKLRHNQSRGVKYDSKLFQNPVVGQLQAESFNNSIASFNSATCPSSESSSTPGVSSPNTSSSESTTEMSSPEVARPTTTVTPEETNTSTILNTSASPNTSAILNSSVDSNGSASSDVTLTSSRENGIAQSAPNSELVPSSSLIVRNKDTRNIAKEKRHSMSPITSKPNKSANRHSAEIISASFLDKPNLLKGSSMRNSRRFPAPYVALFPYKPLKPDELELKKGGIYMVWEKCQDGWYKGSSAGGRSGVFPGNYVMATRHAQKPARSAPPAPPRQVESQSQSLPWTNTSNQSTANSEKAKDKPKTEKSALSTGASLMKRLAAMKGARVPQAGYSVDNPAFISHLLSEEPGTSAGEATPSHVRSGSCPSQLLETSNVAMGMRVTPVGRATLHGTKPHVRSSLEQAWPGVREHRKSQSLDATHGRKPQATTTVNVNERCRCIVSYPPNSEYELELKVGDIVRVTKRRSDGWLKGTLEANGRSGLFPASFVEAAPLNK